MGKRETQMHLRLTEEEKLAIEHEAKRHGTTMSTWLRLVIRGRLGMRSEKDELLAQV
jgi:hypothetical protein